MKLYKSTLLLVLICTFILPSPASAEVPLLINYRGYVDISDPLIGLPTGALTIDLEFTLYDSSEIESATPLWTEEQTVQLLDGNFAVMLGSVTPLSLDLFSGGLRYLTVGFEEQTIVDPQQILSVPYAMQAGNVYSSPDGKVGVGTTNPSTELDVNGTAVISTKLGIGTSSPANKLHVVGDEKIEGSLIVDNPLGSLQVSTSSQIPAQFKGSTHSIVVIQGATGMERSVQFWDETDTPQWKIGMDDGPTEARNDLSIKHVNNATPELVVTTEGNVGIGTTTPATKLDVNGAIGGFGIVPIGTILPWHKSLPGVPELPDGWVECNGQVLSASDSPLNGQIMPDLNAAGRFLRGATESGTFQDDMMQDHSHIDSGHNHSIYLSDYGFPDGSGDRTANYYWMNSERASASQREYKNTSTTTANLGGPSTYGGNVPRVGSETRPVNMSVVWIIRVK